MDINDFEKNFQSVLDWMMNYFRGIENYPVKSGVKVRGIFDKLPAHPPPAGEEFSSIMIDFDEIIMPGITHWQHPKFFAYFPANSSYPSVAAEMLTSALAAQCMKWETSPAAAELEEVVMNWLKEMTGIPKLFHGVIQDTASTSTLAAIITAREVMSGFSVNKSGYSGSEKFRVYGSTETHSSIEKAVKIAGIGRDNLVKVPVNEKSEMRTDDLENAILRDIEKGFVPLCVVVTLGTTGTTAIDSLKDIVKLKKKYGFRVHVDAAFLGSALLLPEYKWMLEGIEEADTFVFNPHKWLFTNFDCSAYFVKDKNDLLNTFEIIPEYLKTRADSLANNYCDWGIPLGRRFRALKLWFVIRTYGTEGLKEILRRHLSLAENLYGQIHSEKNFEILAPLTANLVCFRYCPQGKTEEELNAINEKLMHSLN
ncbi:MAG: pyridoxal-dependent decarboxylase, partial [Ignavibacteria bacterium]|nr:pyridoxal-dependent decarboxylase [Ignavibacteria bacterium]